jgi:hypothetical protein
VAPGAAWVATPHDTWDYAGTLTLKAAGLETVETNEARNTWLEISRPIPLRPGLAPIGACWVAK